MWLLSSLLAAVLFAAATVFFKINLNHRDSPTIFNVELIDAKTIAGETDFAFFNTSLENFTMYKKNEEKGYYRTVMLSGICRTASCQANGSHYTTCQRD